MPTLLPPVLAACLFLLPLPAHASHPTTDTAQTPPPGSAEGEVEARSLLGTPLRAPALPDAVRAERERQLAEAESAHAARPNDELAAVWHGRRLAYLGRYRDAVSVFTAALEKHPESVRLLRHRGHRLITLRRFEDAVRDLERAAALAVGTPNRIEPDGMPNARNIPLSTTQGNVHYHLGLARYLLGDYAGAASAYQSCLDLARNDDMACASAYWLHLALHRAGRLEDAARVLDGIHADMPLIENFSYHRLLMLFKDGTAGRATTEVLRADQAGLDDATQAYGLAAWHRLHGADARGLERMRALVEGHPDQWAAFGFIAAEAELARSAEAPDPVVADLQEIVDRFLEASAAPGVSVAVIDRAGTLRTACAGTADRASGRALTAADRMLAGSTGKTFWGAAALLLVQDGTLELDAPITRWLGDAPWLDRLPNGKDITLRMLLDHTSGLPRYVMLPEFVAAAAEPDRTWTPAERLSFVLDLPAAFPAGQGWSYADTNYIVLGAIVERATGRSFEEVVRERVLDRLDLHDVVFSDRQDLPEMAVGYVDVPRNLFGLEHPAVIRDGRFVYNLSFEWAGGGFAATPRALAAWARALYGGGVLDPATAQALREGVPASLGGSDDRYGLGVMMRAGPDGAGPVLGHAGYMPGYLTDMAWYEGLGVAAAVQVNTTAMGPALNPLALRRLLDACAESVR